jgi:hypothetical protein
MRGQAMRNEGRRSRDDDEGNYGSRRGRRGLNQGRDFGQSTSRRSHAYE